MLWITYPNVRIDTLSGVQISVIMDRQGPSRKNLTG